jgi:hypothetical protein
MRFEPMIRCVRMLAAGAALLGAAAAAQGVWAPPQQADDDDSMTSSSSSAGFELTGSFMAREPMSGGGFSLVGGVSAAAEHDDSNAESEPNDGGQDPAPGRGTLDIDKLAALLDAWGQCTQSSPADLNNDQMVDLGDLVMMIEAWNNGT